MRLLIPRGSRKFLPEGSLRSPRNSSLIEIRVD